MKASIRIDALEFRTCNEHLLSDGEHTTGEIVKWEQTGYCVLAFWRESDCAFNLYYVGRRPFECGNLAAFHRLAAVGQTLLDEGAPYEGA